VGLHWEIPWNIDLNISNESQDCKIGTVCVGGVLVGGGRWMKEIKKGYMVDGLHILTWNGTKKPPGIVLSRGAEG
jgi:hypothetical protein